MQNHTKRSMSDVRINAFKQIISKNRIVEDETMRKVLGCSVATYRREMPFYLQACSNVVHDERLKVVGYEVEIDKAITERTK